MRPNLPRGQAPAKGILHTEQREPAKTITRVDGTTAEQRDPRGYWLGQHAAPTSTRLRRLGVRAVGRRQYLKQMKGARRG